MKLDTEFIKLPFEFDVERMQAEVAAIPESDWRPHPQGHPGNSALPLIALGGNPMDDGVAGTMLPTPHLEKCEYLQQVLASFETVFGRSRLMRLEGKSEATLHVDTNYYWADRVRIHVPITTSPVIEFICNERSVHMAAGESWIFDAWRLHNVLNPTGDQRIHLVADTVGSAAFWDLVGRGERPFAENGAKPAAAELVPYRPGAEVRLETEHSNYPVVMSPWEQEHLARSLEQDLGEGDTAEAVAFRAALSSFLRDWRVAWARYGESREGWETYERLRQSFDSALKPVEQKLALAFNNADAAEIARQMLIRPALNPQMAGNGNGATGNSGAPAAAAAAPRIAAQRGVQRSRTLHRFQRPIFIVAPPRSGTSLLFETLARSADVWTVGGESHAVIEALPGLQPANRGWDSNRLTPTDATPQAAERLRAGFLAQLRNRDSDPLPEGGEPVRMLEKTPKNSLRVPFLNAVFPQALFVYLYRDPRESLSSMITAWESGRFVTYPDLPGWEGPPWSLVLTPEWRKLTGASLAEVVADQWQKATQVLLADLERLPAERVHALDYAALVEDPSASSRRSASSPGSSSTPRWRRRCRSPATPSTHPPRTNGGATRSSSSRCWRRSSPPPSAAATCSSVRPRRPPPPIRRVPHRAPPHPRLAASQRQHRELSRGARPAQLLTGDQHLPDRPPDLRPQGGRRPQHPLPRLRDADGPRWQGRSSRSGPAHRSGSTRTCPRSARSSSRRPRSTTPA